MGQVMVIYKMVAHPGRGTELVAAFEDEMFEEIAREDGTQMYILSRSQDDPDVVWCTELFTDSDAFDTHRTGDVAKRLSPVLGELVASRDVLIGTPLKGFGVEI